MTQTLLFFDHNEKFVETYDKVIGKFVSENIKVHFVHGDVEDIYTMYNVLALVSPANSFGFMDGGIDNVYMEMFPDIQKRVQERIKQFGIQTELDRYALPIGCAMSVSTKDDLCPLMLCVPTMFFPGDITETQNAYWAMRGLLKLIQTTLPENIIVGIPCFGTGVGKMTAEQSAKQILQALQDNQNPDNASQLKGVVTRNAYIMACPQPDNYANREANTLK